MQLSLSSTAAASSDLAGGSVGLLKGGNQCEGRQEGRDEEQGVQAQVADQEGVECHRVGAIRIVELVRAVVAQHHVVEHLRSGTYRFASIPSVSKLGMMQGAGHGFLTDVMQLRILEPAAMRRNDVQHQ
jgi:hypothetical protein